MSIPDSLFDEAKGFVERNPAMGFRSASEFVTHATRGELLRLRQLVGELPGVGESVLDRRVRAVREREKRLG